MRRYVLVWAALVVATAVSVLISEDEFGSLTLTAGVVLAAAFLKVRLIAVHFMEVRTAPLWLRAFFEAYVSIVLATLFVLYVAT